LSDKIRLRHLIPKEIIKSDYEKEEVFHNQELNSKYNKNDINDSKPGRRNNLVVSGVILKPFKLTNKKLENEEPKMNLKKNKKKIKEDLSNYYDLIYLEKREN